MRRVQENMVDFHDLEITMAMGRARRIVYAGITMSKMCSHDWPWANKCSTSLRSPWNASRAIARTFCPTVLSPCANANLSDVDPMAGARWSSDCAMQLNQKWRVTASSLRT